MAEVTVYNRWGQVVYHSEKEYNSHPWNGALENSGKTLPVDSYHYVIQMYGTVVSRGIVSIIK